MVTGWEDSEVVIERDVGVIAGDGVRLSVDVYRPRRTGRYPAILEHIPYRKDDLRALEDRSQNGFLVEAGFACVRLDVRGTGSSAGVAEDEYTHREQLDGVEVVEWIAAQPWCTGAVASWGVSYGGFACIQLAAQRPPALRAIAPVYATDDRYTDDMHFHGGALNASSLPAYPTSMIGMNAMPPLGERGAESDRAWRERVEATPAWIVEWDRVDGTTTRLLAERLSAALLRTNRLPGARLCRLAGRLPHGSSADVPEPAGAVAAGRRSVVPQAARPRCPRPSVSVPRRDGTVLPAASGRG